MRGKCNYERFVFEYPARFIGAKRYAQSVYFLDPNENILEFIARFDLPNASEEPFDTHSILSISEIGLICDHPTQLANEIQSKIQIPFFTKNPRNEGEENPFEVLGDDNGLLLLVRTNRNWYPTEKGAQKHYVKVRFKNGEETVEMVVNNKANVGS